MYAVVSAATVDLIIAVLPVQGVGVGVAGRSSAKFELPRSLEVVTEQEGIACSVAAREHPVARLRCS